MSVQSESGETQIERVTTVPTPVEPMDSKTGSTPSREPNNNSTDSQILIINQLEHLSRTASDTNYSSTGASTRVVIDNLQNFEEYGLQTESLLQISKAFDMLRKMRKESKQIRKMNSDPKLHS